MDTGDVIDILNDLIETCKDGEYGFRTSAEHIQSADVKQALMRRADECRQGADELQQLVVRLGATPDEGGSARGAVHRGWVAVKGVLSGYSDHAILEETERGEDAALARYRTAIEKDLPADVRTVVERQYEGVKRNHAQVRQLRDAARVVR